ncbi:cytochrome P450 [Bimuria novae-zelandiae CBS 107.79]|uniref:Cytochrome P450 n=1 Tax=Bimuria novae-zelandiae CBS 107.79 TaxID=1447943 RepID=A0A6A5W1H3_9PLEO|nr:cytochrome P450 [Bimuria novae-zelandiae CBS 107.79]
MTGDPAAAKTITLRSTLANIPRFIYNLYLHPLPKFPGPACLAFSDIPLSFLQLEGTSQYRLRTAHEKYGSVVRIAPRTLSFISPSTWKDIYGFRNGRAALPKDPKFYNDMLLPDITPTRANDDEAVPIRRAMNSAFSPKSLLGQESMIVGHIHRLLGQLRKETYHDYLNKISNNKAVDFRKWIIFSMFDINSDFGFGEDMGCVAEGRFHEWVRFVVEFFYAATLIYQCYKFVPLNELLTLFIPRMAKQTDRPDFMHHFVASAEKEGLSLPVIEAQASILILAGSETTAVALTGAVYYVLSHPAIHERLNKDIRETFKTAEDIELKTALKKLPYLDAVVQETLRTHAPLPNGFTRLVTDKGGAMTVISINNYCCNTATENYTDPFVFAPERWFGDKKYASDNRNAVQPFLVGPRNCPGKMFALSNMKLLLTHLIWNFDMELDKSTKDWHVGEKVYNSWIQPDFPVYLSGRVK